MADELKYNPEQLHKIMLENILSMLFEQHQALANSIRNLSIDPGIKGNCLYSVGCGFLWAKDALLSIPFVEQESVKDNVE